jgi:uncharacterized Fe-S cluster protein YjdI/CDGSH-type Zn-finger protein
MEGSRTEGNMSEKTTYSGKHIDVQWDGRLCIHVGECGRASGDLFVGGRDPWCQPHLATVAESAEIIRRCPTGALSYTPKDSTAAERAPPENEITVSPNGPLYARGDLVIAGAPNDQPGLRFRAALCRCGQSANKPFCDNSHVTANFQDSGAVGEQGSERSTNGGALTIKALTDGPLLCTGNLTLRSGATGRTVSLRRIEKQAFLRRQP